ncbi:hypothetical protein BH23BAC1_BH23BAC1_10260 [soil metagenome]
MIKTFTQDDLVRYLYKETSEEENREIATALLCDSDLMDSYRQLNAIKEELDLIMKYPSDRVANNILEYSRSFDLHSV